MLVTEGSTKNLNNKAKRTPAHIAGISTFTLLVVHFKIWSILQLQEFVKRNAIICFDLYYNVILIL